ncbi:MAG: MFS transporter [Firmicutes bacterium]|nr:MFS transporter [Bacillota bacterium]
MSKRLNFWYGSIFGTYWMIYAVVSSFASVFMLAKGYANAQIGMTLAAANILAVVLQPLTANLADRSQKIGAIGISGIMTVMMMVFTLGMFFFGGGSIALCTTFVLLIAWHTALQPMFNALTFKLEESGIPVNFGIARSVGSLAYSILVAILGTLVEHLGIMTLPMTSEITCCMLLISLILTKRIFDKAKAQRLASEDQKTGEERKPVSADQDPEETISLMEFIRRNKLFFVLNIGVVGLFFSNSVLNNYMVQIVTDVGGTSEDMGRILGVMAFLEIPTMVFFSRLKRKFSCQLLLKVAAVGFTAKIGLCWLAGSVGMLYVAQLFQLVSFALFLPGMVYFTGENMSPGEAVRGQALFTTMITITTIFSSLLGGWILDVSGAKTLTLISTLATAAGAVIIFAVVDRIRK